MLLPAELAKMLLLPRSQDLNDSGTDVAGNPLPPFYIPPGYGQPGYVPENIGPACGTAIIVMLALVIFLVPLRLYTRACITKAFGIDDWLIAVAAVFAVGTQVSNLLAIFKWHLGLHMIDYDPLYHFKKTQGHFLKLIYISGILHACGMFLLKMSVLLFFRRVMDTGQTRYTLNVLTVIIFVFSIAWILLQVFVCFPPHSFWSGARPEEKGKCMSFAITNRLIPLGHCITDLAVWVVPIPSVLRLQMDRKNKIATCFLFALGAGSILASIARATHYDINEFITDATYVPPKFFLFSAIELLLGIICASLFTFKQLFHRRWWRRPTTHIILSDGNLKSLESAAVGASSSEKADIGSSKTVMP